MEPCVKAILAQVYVHDNKINIQGKAPLIPYFREFIVYFPLYSFCFMYLHVFLMDVSISVSLCIENSSLFAMQHFSFFSQNKIQNDYTPFDLQSIALNKKDDNLSISSGKTQTAIEINDRHNKSVRVAEQLNI